MTDEIKAMLAQGEEKLRAARLLLEGSAWGDASSRAYYARAPVIAKSLGLCSPPACAGHADKRSGYRGAHC